MALRAYQPGQPRLQGISCGRLKLRDELSAAFRPVQIGTGKTRTCQALGFFSPGVAHIFDETFKRNSDFSKALRWVEQPSIVEAIILCPEPSNVRAGNRGVATADGGGTINGFTKRDIRLE